MQQPKAAQKSNGKDSSDGMPGLVETVFLVQITLVSDGGADR